MTMHGWRDAQKITPAVNKLVLAWKANSFFLAHWTGTHWVGTSGQIAVRYWRPLPEPPSQPDEQENTLWRDLLRVIEIAKANEQWGDTLWPKCPHCGNDLSGAIEGDTWISIYCVACLWTVSPSISDPVKKPDLVENLRALSNKKGSVERRAADEIQRLRLNMTYKARPEEDGRVAAPCRFDEPCDGCDWLGEECLVDRRRPIRLASDEE